jgi:hypothetical protein
MCIIYSSTMYIYNIQDIYFLEFGFVQHIKKESGSSKIPLTYRKPPQFNELGHGGIDPLGRPRWASRAAA